MDVLRNALVLLLTTVTLAGCTSSPSADGSDGAPEGDAMPGPGSGGSAGGSAAPALSVGDSWVEILTSDSAPPVSMTSTTTVEAIEDVVVAGMEYSTYRLMVDPGATTMWIRTSDHAVVKTHSEIAGFAVDLVYEEPCGKSQWPLRVGDEWSVDCTAQSSTTTPFGAVESESSTSASYKVDAVESVTVPAGTFQAFKISYTETSGASSATGTIWYAAAACHHAKIMQASGGVSTTSELESFSCAKA